MKTRTITYWTTTTIIAFVLISGGIAELIQRPETIEGMTHLGYPLYFTMILAFWKLTGGITLLVPGFPRLKEWAYAGTFFELTGAAVSHAVLRDDIGHVIWPLVFTMVAVVSWALRPPSRTLGVVVSTQSAAIGINT
jgi:hypothetical protein